jgi:hypothetical protein
LEDFRFNFAGAFHLAEARTVHDALSDKCGNCFHFVRIGFTGTFHTSLEHVIKDPLLFGAHVCAHFAAFK